MNQPAQALALAQRIRTDAHALGREIARLPYHEGRGLVAEMLRHPTETVARMRLSDLLTSIRNISDNKAIRLLDAAGLTRGAWTRRVGPVDITELTLSERQRLALAEVLKP